MPVRRSMGWPRTPWRPKIAIQNDEVTLSSAAWLDGTHCSAHTLKPFDTAIRSSAITKSCFTSVAPTAMRSPRARATTASAIPAIMKRMPANRNGGR